MNWSCEGVSRRVSSGVVLVAGSSQSAQREIGGSGMRAFPVRLPSGQRYWTVLDEDLAVVPVADGFLRQGWGGRGGGGWTAQRYRNPRALFFRGGGPGGGAVGGGGGRGGTVSGRLVG